MAKQKTAGKKTAGKSGAKKKQQQERTYPKGVEVLSSKVSFEGPIFRVVTDEVMEPGRSVVIEQQAAHDEGSEPASYKGVRARSRHALPPLPFQADEGAHTDGHQEPEAELNSADSRHAIFLVPI